MRKRRRSRRGVWLVVVAVVLVAVGVLAGLTFYGSALGIPFFSHAPTGDSFALSNITLTSLPDIQDGYAGLSVSANIANHGTAKIQNTTVWVDSLAIGSCTTSIQPQQQAQCKIGKDVPCQSFPSAPYAIKVTAEFHDGNTYTANGQISEALTTTC